MSYTRSTSTPNASNGRRIASLTHQPVYAFVELFIGDILLTTKPPKPNMIQQFNMTRLEGIGDKAYITIFDDNWTNIEALLAAHPQDIRVKYGYTNGIESPLYYFEVASYSLDFNSTGTILSIQATTGGYQDSLQQRIIITGTKNPTEAIKLISETMKWTIEDENFDATEDVIRETPFDIHNEEVLSYITNVIVPVARTKVEGETLTFWLDSTTSPPTAFFKIKKTSNELVETPITDEGSQVHSSSVDVYDVVNPVTRNTLPTIENPERSAMSVTQENIRTFVFQKGYDSVVINATFDVKGIFGGTTTIRDVIPGNGGILTGANISRIDPDNKNIRNTKLTIDDARTNLAGNYTHTPASQSVAVVGAAAYTPQEIENQVLYTLQNATDAYEAQLTIIGDPGIKLLEYVHIVNMTDFGDLHHTSGQYQIIGIDDTVSNGMMTTSLKLIRNEDIDAGSEIINPTDPDTPRDLVTPPSYLSGKIIVGTFNIKRGTYKNSTYSTIANIIKGANIIGLQEVTPKGAEAIANAANKNVRMCSTIENYGHCIVSSIDINQILQVDLPGAGEHRRVHIVQTNGVTFYNTHLHYTEKVNQEQLAALVNLLRNDTSNIIVVAGDFNSHNFTSITDLGFTQVNTGEDIMNTSGGKSEVSTIDQIFVKGAKINRVWQYEAKENKYSDHDALFAELDLTKTS